MQKEKTPQQTHGSLEKGVRLISAFIPDNKELGIVELAKLFSMNRSTVSRMLTVLKKLGFVLQNPVNRKYSLGPYVSNLAAAYQGTFESTLAQLAKPCLDELRNQVGNTVILALPSDGQMVIAYVSEGLGPIRVAAQIGDRRFLHSTAGGRCLMAHSSQNLIQKVLDSDLARMTPATIVDPEILRKELETIRQRGFAFDREGNFPGISAFSVPILNRKGLPIAAITVAGPSSTVSWQNRIFFIEKQQAAAAALRSILSGDGETPEE